MVGAHKLYPKKLQAAELLFKILAAFASGEPKNNKNNALGFAICPLFQTLSNGQSVGGPIRPSKMLYLEVPKRRSRTLGRCDSPWVNR